MANILVSACLLGIPCRYKGDARPSEWVRALNDRHSLIPVCPEQLGGLATPRNPAEQQSGRVVNTQGEDVTVPFERGAQAALALARLNHVVCAVLKARSPSCGSGEIYDGSFSGRLIPGDGVSAALLKQNGIRVFTENEQDAFEAYLKTLNV